MFSLENMAFVITLNHLKRLFQAGFVGEPGGIRTHDLLIRSQTLYPAELRAHMLFGIVPEAA